MHVHRSGRKITHTAQFIIQYLPRSSLPRRLSVVPFSLRTLPFAQYADSHTPQQKHTPHTRTSLGLDAEHEEGAYFDVELRHLGRRPGHPLVPEECSVDSSSPAVNESRRAFKRAFLSFSRGSATSARSFPWLQRLGDVAAGGRPCLYGAFAACTVASDSPTAD